MFLSVFCSGELVTMTGPDTLVDSIENLNETAVKLMNDVLAIFVPQTP